RKQSERQRAEVRCQRDSYGRGHEQSLDPLSVSFISGHDDCLVHAGTPLPNSRPPARSRTSRVSRPHRSQLKSAARLSPRLLILLRSSSSNKTASIFTAISSMESGSKYSSALPEISGKQEFSETMAGTPHAIDSTMGRQKPSYSDGITTSAAPLSSNARSCLLSVPGKMTCPRVLCDSSASATTCWCSQSSGPANTRSRS